MEKCKKRYSLEKLTYLALLTAACVVGRLSFSFIPNVQPMTAIFLLLAFIGTLPDALTVCLLGVIITNLYLGMGAWTISQLVAYTVIILCFYFLSKLPFVKRNCLRQAVLAFLCGLLYGLAVSRMEVWLYHLPVFWAYYSQGIVFDLLHGAGNFGFYLILWPVFQRLSKRFQLFKQVPKERKQK